MANRDTLDTQEAVDALLETFDPELAAATRERLNDSDHVVEPPLPVPRGNDEANQDDEFYSEEDEMEARQTESAKKMQTGS